MKYKKSTIKALQSFIFFYLTQEICNQECGWAYRVEHFLRVREALDGSWPWLVAIMGPNIYGLHSQECTGSLITDKHVLTAAHCFENYNRSFYKAKIGDIDERAGSMYNIIRITIHDTYVRDEYYGDIAILTLDRKVEERNFNPICLPPSRAFVNLTGQFTAVAGWGALSPSEPTYPKVREAFGLEVISNSMCNDIFGRKDCFERQFPHDIADGMICTAYLDECVGNSGSPLMYQVDEQWYIVGVKAFGQPCDEPHFPTGFTRVTEYLDWIENTIEQRCGFSHRTNDSLGNGDAPLGSWPWMASLVMKNQEHKGVHDCTGIMISRRHVLTAAHCFEGRNRNPYNARVGHVDDRFAKEYSISEIILHENYKKGEFYDDIAILILAGDVDSENFNPVCLPPNREAGNLTGRNIAVVGWSNVRTLQNHSVLKENFDVKVVPHSECNKIFRRRSAGFKHQFKQGITDGMLCADYTNECLADSGSPLVYQEDEKWHVGGIVSFGMPCHGKHFPTGFMRVSYYLEWIDKIIKS